MSITSWWHELPHHLIAFTHTYGFTAYIALVLALILRTSIVLGSLVPGGLLLFASGFVSASYPKGFWVPSALGFGFGTTIGCWIGYELTLWLVNHPRGPDWLRPQPWATNRMQGLYRRFGPISAAFAVSQPWACSLAPWVAIQCRVPKAKYLASAALGAFVWTGVMFTFGLLAGISTR